MTVTTKAEKPTFTFTAGFVTEQSPVNVVPGSALDMDNFEIEVAGALRRRKAIAQESGGSDIQFLGSVIPLDSAYVHKLWTNAGGTPGRILHVVQVGTSLMLMPEGDTISNAGPTLGPLNLLAFKTTSATEAQVASNPVGITSARSHLIVTGTYIRPFYVALSGNDYTPQFIQIYIRDFVGIEDGVSVTNQPTTETASHIYNLKNRGWTDEEIADYLDDIGTYPAKNMIPWLGYIREVDAGTQEGFGTKAWNSAKLEAEAFRNVSAPQGSLLLDPFNTTTAITGGGGSVEVVANIPISTWTRTGSVIDMTLTLDHGIATGDSVEITGNAYSYQFVVPTLIRHKSLDGVYTVTVTGSNTIRFNVPDALFDGWVGWEDQYDSLGTAIVSTEVEEGGGVSSTNGYITDYRPTSVAWFAGRVFYAGCQYHKLADTVFFSQIIEDAAQYGRCYQRNDPTAENFNALLATDGGTIKIPGLHSVIGMEILGSSLLLFSRAGVWEIRGGQGGFTATDFLVRKVTDAECTSVAGICRTDDGIVFATKRGLFAVGFDSNSGLITAGNLTQATINTYWSDISDPQLDTISVVYDDARKRVYTLISKPTPYVTSANPRQLTEALVLDFRVKSGGAFYKLTLPYSAAGHIIGGLALDNMDNPVTNKKIKFVWKVTDSGAVSFLDMDQTTFTDHDGEDRPPFLKATHDAAVPTEPDEDGRVASNWHKRKQAALYVYMFLGRTETGWEEIDDELYPINTSSVILQGRWEWSDSNNSGKWGSTQQAYRHRQLYTPFDPDEGVVGGFPVIVTRNKIRGSGRALSLYIRGEAAKDAHILGWLIQYGVT